VSISIITLVVFLSLMVLLLVGLPVAFSLLAVAIVGYMIFVSPTIPMIFFSIAFSVLTSPIYIAVPLFIFMAAVLEFSGIANTLYDTMYKWLARLKGGLAMGTIVISTILAACTGIAATATITMGMIAYPEMKKRGYDKKLSIGAICFGGVLGPLIPPSVVMVIVGGYANLSVGKLFMGGVFPGLALSTLVILYLATVCQLKPSLAPVIPIQERASWKEKLISLRGIALPVFIILIVLGGIYSGACTPTEAGAIGAIGTLLVSIALRRVNIANLKNAVIATTKITAMVYWLIIGGSSFSALCGRIGVADFIGDIIIGIGGQSILAVIVMLAVVFVLGMFIDCNAIIIICMPIFMPVILQLGVDPLWFALIFVIAILLGYITPPFAYNLFFFKGLGYSEVSMNDIYRAIIPFVILTVIILAVCIAFPSICTWLPSTMSK
jgi:tripartite ATP-independent transporter DctM subunit